MEKMKKRLSYLFMATAILFTSMPFPGMGKVMAAEGNKQARNIISDRNEKELSFAVDEAGGKDLWAKEKDDDVNASTIKGKLRIPEIPGYTLVQNTEDIDLEKYYILVSVGADNTPYAFYGMNTGFFH